MFPQPSRPYHTVAGRSITVYLNIVQDTDAQVDVDNALAALAADWIPIAAANNLNLTIALGPDTATPVVIPTALNVVKVNTHPPDVRFFDFTMGRGAHADKDTRSASISYVNYDRGTGYIYQMPGNVPQLGNAISHELGHVLGLSDRYYDAVFWMRDYAIDMTCEEIRKDKWVDAADTDRRIGIQDTGGHTKDRPRLAVRAPVPIRIIGEPSVSNLMSDNDRSLSPVQVNYILARGEEPDYRGHNWVAILGEWKVYEELKDDVDWVPPAAPQRATATPTEQPGWLTTVASDLVTGTSPLMPADHVNDPDMWRYPSRPPTALEKGKGIVFGPPDHTTLHRYPCLRAFGKAKDEGNGVVGHPRIGVAMGRRRLVRPDGSKSVNPVWSHHPHWMCYVRRVINDLL
jgi:hypothetical protein